MPRIERNFEQTIKNLKRDVVELKRTSQASLVGYVDKETGKIKDTLEDLNVDVRSPAAPVEVVADFYVHESYNGKRREGYITIASAPVTKATDGSDIQVSKYEMWARSAEYEAGSEPPFELQSSATDPSLRSLPVEQYKPYEVVIRAVTPTGRPGLFSEVKTVTVTDDDTPPPMPSQLTLSQSLAVVEMTWDGLSFGETLMPLDFWRTEIGVRYGGASEYTVITEWFEEAGIRYYTGAPVNELLYISHRSYDYAGNVSGWTEPATITVVPVVDEESIRLRLEEVQNIIDQVGDEVEQSRLQLEQELSDARDRLDQNDQLMDQLVNTDLPALNQELDANTGIINNLNDVVLPDLNTRLSGAEDDLAQSRIEWDGRLDQAETDISNAEANLSNLETVELPAMNQRIEDARAEASTMGAELDGRLDQAETDITAATSSLSDIEDVQLPALNTRLGEAETELSTAKTELSGRLSTAETGLSNAQGLIDQLEGDVVLAAKTAAIEDLYVSGVGTIKTAVVDKLWADVITARKILASQINVGEFGNLATVDEVRGVNVTFPANYTTVIKNGYVASSPSSQNYIMFKDQTTTVPFVAGDKLRVSFYAKTVGTADIWSFVRLWTYNNVAEDVNSNGPSYTAEYFYVKPTEQFFSMTLTIGSDLTREQQSWIMGLGSGSDVNDIRVRNVRVYRMTGSDLLVNGAVSANHINADSVAGAVAEFIKLDVSQLTASSASISSAVVDKLWADVITARKITTEMLSIGDFESFAPSVATDPGAYTYSGDAFAIDWNLGYDGKGLQVRANPGGTDSDVLGPLRNVRPDDKLFVKFYARLYGGTAINMQCRVYWYQGDGTYIDSSFVRSTLNLTGSEGWLENVVTAPANAAQARVRLWGSGSSNADAVGWVSVHSLTARRMSGGELIVDGSIDALKINAESVAAKVATVIDLDVSRLNASSASISQGVIDKLWADVITARKITTGMLSIGSFDNIIPDPTFTNDGGSWNPMNAIYSIDPTGGQGGTTALKITRTTASQFGKYTEWMPSMPGATYRLIAWVKANGPIPVGAITIYGRVQNKSDGTTRPGVVGSNASVIPANTWAKVEATYTVIEDSKTMGFGIYSQATLPAGVNVWVDSFSATRMSSGELIVSGSITGDHLDVNSVSAKVASVIKLNASTITSGTINTARLNTTAIAAATASIQKADVANLTASSATISQAVIEKLWADVITARKITTGMLSIGDFESFAPSIATDPEAYTYSGDAKAIEWALGYDGKGMQIRANPGAGDSYVYGPRRNVRPDDRIYVKAWAKLYNDTAINVQLRVYWYDGDGAYVASSFVRSTDQLTGTQGWLEGVAVAPAGAAQARLRVWGYGSSDAGAVGWVSVHSLTARRMNGGELIVDGAILANHITASQSLSAKVAEFLEVKAGMIKANAVTAGTINGGAIDGMVITGATVRTSSSSSRVEMNSTGIHAWKSGSKTFQLLSSTGEFEAVGSIQTGSDTSYRAKLSNRAGIAALDIYGSGGASAPHLAAIYTSNQSIIRNYTNESSFSGGLAIANTWTRLDQENGSKLTLYKDSLGLEVAGGGQLYMNGTRTQLTTDTGNMLDMDSDGIRILSGPGGTVFDEVVLSGTRTLRLPQVTTATTSGGANVNVNNGYLREVASASRYKLNVAPIDESIDDRILSVEAVTWFDKSNAEILSEAMTPQSEGKKDVAIPSNAEKRIPGVIAEQVLESGLDEFVIFGDDGEVQSVMYDRMGVALIPVVKRLRERVVSLEGNLSDAIGRLDAAGL